MSKNNDQPNYIRNTKTSRNRTIRIEVIGGADEMEGQFLDGVALFLAGTLGKESVSHTKYVAEQMAKMVKGIVMKLKKDMGGE